MIIRCHEHYADSDQIDDQSKLNRIQQYLYQTYADLNQVQRTSKKQRANSKNIPGEQD